jgi:acylphosphatase
VRVRFRVRGLVQGIGFRYWTQDAARRLGLSGWIQNEADGSVSGVAEGSNESMGIFREVLGVGPEHSKIRQLDWDLDKDTEAGGESLPLPFEIRR